MTHYDTSQSSIQEDYPDFVLSKDYYVTRPMLDFYKYFIQKYNNVAILTVFRERCTKLSHILKEEISNFQEKIQKNELIISTPNIFLEKNVIKYFVIIEDPQLIGPFNYLNTIKSIKSNNSLIGVSDKIINFDFLKNPIVISSSRKCFIRADHEKSFVILFCLIKYNIIKDDLSIVVRTTQMKKKVELFLKTFGYGRYNKVFLPDEISGGRLVVFSDEQLGLEAVDVIYLSKDKIEGLKENSFDFSKGEEFIYKIRDVLSALTTNVCKELKPFPYQRFKNLENVLK